MTPEQNIIEFAGRNHGVALVSTYFEAGGTPDGLKNLLRHDHWARVSYRVIRSTAAPVTPRQQALAAVLDAGPSAALSHDSGAALCGVPGFDLLPAHVLRLRTTDRHRARLGQMHWATVLPEEFVMSIDGIPVVRPAVLALLLFGSHHPLRARRAVATMLAKHLVTLESLSSILDSLAVQGRNGIVALRMFVEEERRRGRPLDSGLERRFEWLLDNAGERRMRAQVDLGDAEGWIGRVDFVDEDVPLVVEIDSDRHHGSVVDRDADAKRTAALEAAGYTVVRFTDDDLWFHGDRVVDTVRRLRRELKRRRSVA